ncbi:hypothetical protein CRE_22460 [Caenorhabditis remanei]|uniref:Uncharacterized protein n=1 Tax=Caenorhabditis remanei TaxID=31234 RepID=E3MEA9_CAERE|nr:hypothetical protein CRE_22460 [Caenorhabditis remanei]
MDNNGLSSDVNVAPFAPNIPSEPPNGLSAEGRLFNAPAEPHPYVRQMGPPSGIERFPPPTYPTFVNPQMIFASKKDRSKWLYEFAERLDGTEKRTAEKQKIIKLLEKESTEQDITFTKLCEEYRIMQRKNEEMKREQADCPEFNQIEAEAQNEFLVEQEVVDKVTIHHRIKTVFDKQIETSCPSVPEATQLTPNEEIPDDRHPLLAYCENNEVFLNETIAHFEKGLLERRERLTKLMIDFSQLELDTKQRAAHLNYNRNIARARQGLKRKLQPDA